MKVICFHNSNEENGYLSNWYHSDFMVDGMKFSSMEQFMMYRKAVCFHDNLIAKQILETEDVAAIKALGREVSNYDDLKQKLKSTGTAILAECAVRDRIWGIGLSMHDPRRMNPKQWNGKNLLGYTLMMVRDKV